MAPLKLKTENKNPIKRNAGALLLPTPSSPYTTANSDFNAVVDFILAQWLTACRFQSNAVVKIQQQHLKRQCWRQNALF